MHKREVSVLSRQSARDGNEYESIQILSYLTKFWNTTNIKDLGHFMAELSTTSHDFHSQMLSEKLQNESSSSFGPPLRSQHGITDYCIDQQSLGLQMSVNAQMLNPEVQISVPARYLTVDCTEMIKKKNVLMQGPCKPAYSC